MTAVNPPLFPSTNTLEMAHPKSAITSTALTLYPRRAIITVQTPAFVAPPEALRYIAAGWRVQYARPAGVVVVTASGLFAATVSGMWSSGVGVFQDASESETDVQSQTTSEDLDQDANREEKVIELPTAEHAVLENFIADDVIIENDTKEEKAILRALESFFEQQDDTSSFFSTSIHHPDPMESDFTVPLIAITTGGETKNLTEKPTVQGKFESIIEVSPVESKTIHAEEVPAKDKVIVKNPAVGHEHAANENTVPSEHDTTQPEKAPAITTDKYEATSKESAVVKREVIQNESDSEKIIIATKHHDIQLDATHPFSKVTSTFDSSNPKPADFTFRMPSAIITPAIQNEPSNKSKAILASTTGSLFGTNKLEASNFTFTAPQPINTPPLAPPSTQQTTRKADEHVPQDPTSSAASSPAAMDWEPTSQHSAASTESTLEKPVLPRTPFTFATPVRPTAAASAPAPTFLPTLARFGTAALQREAFTFSVGGSAGAGEQPRRGSGESSSGGSGVSGVFSGGSREAGESSASSVAGSEEDEAVMGFLGRAFRGGEKDGDGEGKGEMSRGEGGKARENGGRKKRAGKGKKKSENKNAVWGKKGGKKGGKGKKI